MSDVLENTGTSLRKPLVATFLTCLLLGPPVGGLVMVLSVMSDGVDVSTASNFERVATAIFSGLFIIPFSYISGGLSALASGLAMVVYGRLKGLPPLWFAIACAVVTFAVLQYFQNDQSPTAAFWLLAAHIVPAIVCWLVFKRFWSVPS